MRLLIVTQKVTKADPILGFFVRWIEEFAKRCESVTVIGQLVRQESLPENVRVFSMGKEQRMPRFVQVWTFWRHIWTQGDRYDAVLVHMTPIWVVLGAPIWWVLRKPVYLWYEARGNRWPLRLAARLVRYTFSASEKNPVVPKEKSNVVGHGIDVELFRPSHAYEENLLVSVGRITKAKRVEVLLASLRHLPHCHLHVVGLPITREDRRYAESLRHAIIHEGLSGRVTMESLPHEKLQHLLPRTQVFLHVSETALDKAVLEAMACGVPVVSTNPTTHRLLPEECHAADDTLVERIQEMLKLSQDERRKLGTQLRQVVVEKHSVQKLVERLLLFMQKSR